MATTEPLTVKLQFDTSHWGLAMAHILAESQAVEIELLRQLCTKLGEEINALQKDSYWRTRWAECNGAITSIRNLHRMTGGEGDYARGYDMAISDVNRILDKLERFRTEVHDVAQD